MIISSQANFFIDLKIQKLSLDDLNRKKNQKCGLENSLFEISDKIGLINSYTFNFFRIWMIPYSYLMKEDVFINSLFLSIVEYDSIDHI